MPENVKCEAHENLGSCTFRHQTLMRNRIKPVQPSFGHPLSDTLRIDAQAKMNPGAQDSRPTSKQVAFAERLARIKRRAVPDECFRDKGLMSKWIDGNK